MASTRAEMLAAVERSPELVRAHDRRGWVGLYTLDGQIEDPVGSRPHRGPDEIDRFYATFIAPREITFHPRADLVVDDTVVRDLDLEVRMSDAVTMRIPAVLRYDLVPAGSELKINRLQAFWELPLMVGQFLRAGPAALPVGGALTVALLRNQGLTGAGGFLAGFRSAGSAGRREFTRFLTDARDGDEVAVRRRLARGARITRGEGEPLAAAELLDRLTDGQWHKVIVAGRHVVAGLQSAAGPAVLIADIEKNPFAITRIRYFDDASAGG
ncbi:nuclear transport factor 2 family protein [Mycolicibacterium sp. S2-37]|uniref:nuclear transport factor 2 family protein n=1 Tax=Mycolicibacterium sp. S2-37 TaxID=2810297 RepID=UPI001A945636|nr:nuclear transport factor 2 family protein [Mycolicibacterium sp. S2-37]MBO0675937.1 nuclear transport factor 2 family protein [Mycolicibacterium sp. S2-37]